MMPKVFGGSLGLLGAVVAIAAIVFGVNSARQAQQLKKQVEELQQNPQQVSQDEVKRLVEQVGKLIALPEGETPTIATITDREKLKDVPFFTKAENDDKVLIYVNARKAFLYRPSSQKLIEVATINLTPRADQSFAPKVALRNGTDVAGLTKRMEDELKRLLPKAEITTRDNAQEAGAEQTIVVDLTGGRKADAERLAAVLNAKVGDLPAGEGKPAGADFLVFIGADRAKAPSPSPASAASPTPSPSPAASPTPSS